MESYEFQAIGMIAPRSRKRTVISRLPRQIALDRERKCAREEESGHSHQSLKPFGPLFPEVSIGFFVGFQ